MSFWRWIFGLDLCAWGGWIYKRSPSTTVVHWQRSPKVLSRSRPFEIQLKFIYLLDVGGDALRAMFTPSQVHHSLRSDRGVNDARRAGQSEQISVQTDDGRYIRVSHKLAFRERAAIPQRRDSADATPLTDQTPETDSGLNNREHYGERGRRQEAWASIH